MKIIQKMQKTQEVSGIRRQMLVFDIQLFFMLGKLRITKMN